MQHTPSVAFSSFVSWGAILLSVAFPRSLRAEELDLAPSAPPSEPLALPSENLDAASQGEGDAKESPTPGGSEVVQSRVRITTVGRALSPSSLERLLGPALQSSFELSFSWAESFAPEDLFRSASGASPGTLVWVDTTGARNVRIYIKNRDGTRYLVRDLESSETFGEMDREAIAQAIEWSLQALAQGTAGMTREEAEELLSAPETSPVRPNGPRPSRMWRRKAEGWLPEVALMYRVAPFSSELIETQGPALRVGADKLEKTSQWGLAAALLYQSPVRHVEPGIALEVQTVGARVEGRYLHTGLAQSLGLGARFGLGVDAVFVSPEIIDPSRFEDAKSSRNLGPVFEGGLVFQMRAESGVRLETSVGFEVDLITLRYEVATTDESRALLSRSAVRPSLSVGVALF
jgi:hypothetical protein